MGRMAVTKATSIRIPPWVKEAAQKKAAEEGKTLSVVVVDLLREYARDEK